MSYPAEKRPKFGHEPELFCPNCGTQGSLWLEFTADIEWGDPNWCVRCETKVWMLEGPRRLHDDEKLTLARLKEEIRLGQK